MKKCKNCDTHAVFKVVLNRDYLVWIYIECPSCKNITPPCSSYAEALECFDDNEFRWWYINLRNENNTITKSIFNGLVLHWMYIEENPKGNHFLLTPPCQTTKQVEEQYAKKDSLWHGVSYPITDREKLKDIKFSKVNFKYE